MSEAKQLRGWKEIAAHLNVSERTVKRWEVERELPIRRLAGGARGVVIAYSNELDAWLLSSSQLAPASDVSVGEDDQVWAGHTPARRSARRTLTIAALALVFICAATYGIARRFEGATPGVATRPQSGPGRKTPSVTLRLTTRDGRVNKLQAPDGGCAAVALSGYPYTELCPRRLGDGLLLDVVTHSKARAAGTESRVTLRLEPESEVRVTSPVSFDVEWVNEQR